MIKKKPLLLWSLKIVSCSRWWSNEMSFRKKSITLCHLRRIPLRKPIWIKSSCMLITTSMIFTHLLLDNLEPAKNLNCIKSILNIVNIIYFISMFIFSLRHFNKFNIYLIANCILALYECHSICSSSFKDSPE